jgi:hypothetical protein
MAAKRKKITALALAQRKVGLELPPERRQHGTVVRRARFIEDDAETRHVWQGLDTTAIMLMRGTITEAMKKAGDLFHDHFRTAGLDGVHAGDPTRPRNRLSHAVLRQDNGSETARLQVITALDALGGINTPGGSCAWHCLGLKESLRGWALRASWGRGRINHHTAAGILIADLGILSRHWGF